MTISVGGIVASDRAQWEELYRGYADFYQVPMDRAILDTVWSWIFDEDFAFYGLVARDESANTVGLMHCREMVSPLRGKKVGFLDDLFVKPECRGQGVVELLYEGLQVLAKQNNWPFTRWITAENNYRGRSVYDKIAEKTHWVTYQMATRQ